MSTTAETAKSLRLQARATRSIAVALVAAGVLAVAPTAIAPDPITTKRQQLEAIQAEVATIDGRLAAAAEAYNGAHYRLSGLEERIRVNAREHNANERALAAARVALSARLRALYTQPDPSLGEILLTSGSLSEATERLDVIERAGEFDHAMVGRIRAHRALLTRTRAALVHDREQTKVELANAEQQRRQIAGLLAERQRVLRQVTGDLARLQTAQRERERREAAAQARTARDRVAAQTDSSDDAEPSEPAASTIIPSGEGNARAAQIALKYLGVPYVWGGASPSGFDCSGLCSYAYAQIGKSVPHYTGAIWSAFPKVPRDQLQAGDIVFFRPDLGHAGIYLGGGQYVHAPHTGDVVKVSSINDRSDYQGAVRP